MKPVLWIFASCAIALTFSSCGNSRNGGSLGNPQAVTGPYDKYGNYIEAWADDPSKWRKSGSSPHEMKSDELPQIAMNDQPPQDAVPLPPISSSSTTAISHTTVTSKPKPPTAKPREVAIQTKPKPKTTTITTTAKPKPATITKVKPKPKPAAKPKSTRYVVKKGDTLSAISRKTGASVSAIKSANGISGSLIRPGQSLTIPKK